jgi:hypothetical protein
MNLTIEQTKEIFERADSWVTSACDDCGKILGCVRCALGRRAGTRERRRPEPQCCFDGFRE